MITRSALICIAVALSAIFIASERALAQEEDSKSQKIAESSDIPDGIAFRQFLLITEPKPGAPDNVGELIFLASALGKHTEVNGDYELLRARYEELEPYRRSLREQELRLSRQTVCTENRASRTAEQNHAALNALDDITIDVGQAELEKFSSSLTEKEAEAFYAYLDRIKLGTSYERIDTREYVSDTAVAVELMCIDLDIKVQELELQR